MRGNIPVRRLREDLNRRFSAAIKEGKREGFVSLKEANQRADELLERLASDWPSANPEDADIKSEKAE